MKDFLNTFPTEVPDHIENVVLPRETYLTLIKAANSNADTLRRADHVLDAAEVGLSQANKRIQQLSQWLESAEATIAEKDEEIAHLKQANGAVPTRIKAEIADLQKQRDEYCRLANANAEYHDAYLRQRSTITALRNQVEQLTKQKMPEGQFVQTNLLGAVPISAVGVMRLDRAAQERIHKLTEKIEMAEKDQRAVKEALLADLEDFIDDHR